MPSLCKRKINSAKVQLYYNVIIRIYLTSVPVQIHLGHTIDSMDQIKLWPFRSSVLSLPEHSLLRTFVPAIFRSRELSFLEPKWMGTFVPSFYRSHQRSPHRKVSLLCYSVGLTTAVKLYSSEVDTITSQNVESCLKNGPAGAYKLCHMWLKRL